MIPHEGPEPGGRGGAAPRTLVLLALGVLLAGSAVAKLSGCAGRSPAEAENREVRLTSDETVKLCPLYSPDNSLIAYAARGGAKPGGFATYVIAPSGGEPRRISPDTLSIVPLSWSTDGEGLLCREVEGRGIYHIGLDGSARLLRKSEPLQRLLAISPDGATELVAMFNKDNRDVGIRRAGGKLEFLAETPAWEEGATFGPGRDEVTVVSVPSYLAPVSTISTWSPATRAYAPLPLPEGKKFEATWSSDGSFLAYAAIAGGQSDIWVYDPASTRATPLIEDPQDAVCPAWSPDAEWLAFIRSTKTSHLFAGEPDSPDRRQLTEGPPRDYAPMASPDGKWIAFLRKRPAKGSEGGTPILCVMPATGGEVREFDLKGVMLPSSGGEALAWSHDSRNIAFSGSDGSTKLDIYRIGRDGEGLARVTVEPGEEVEPRWSPDGRFISYTQAGGGRLEVAIVPAHGGLPRVVSPPETKCEGSVWSPRSDRVAHVQYLAGGRFEVWIAPVAAPEQRKRLFASESLTWPMFWTDDGEELVVMRNPGQGWTVYTLSIAGGAERQVGRVAHNAAGKETVYQFSSGSDRYRRLFYPAGVIVADGKESSDLYVIRARKPLSSRAASSLTPWLPWRDHIAWAGYY